MNLLPGMPEPLGATITHQGINFSIFSRHAEKVTLIIEFDEVINTVREEITLNPRKHRTGNIWHALLAGQYSSLRYGYRIDGPFDPKGSGHSYDKRLILIDPYAKELRSPPWGEARNCLGNRPCCLLEDQLYDWEGDRPLNRPLEDSIIYEMHVRGFTRHPSAQINYPGTFKGVIEKIPYLQELGITAVELMPVTEFDENGSSFTNPTTGEKLKNYWGYSPLSFFAPKTGYSSDPHRPLDEFRDMVKALHKAGIEVILDIVYNHTAEGGDGGNTYSFRGIDNTIYYLLDPWTKAYLNFSGCGNTCNCNHPIVRSLIMDALRWWVIHMHVDGFRFDLASILGRDQSGNVLANPPMVEMIAEDPVLADSKIIAEAWDAAGLYQVGHFSEHHRWAEWNGRFRDDVRAFMCGHPGMVAPLATRIAGSSDLFQHSGRRPCNSINFITSHDGFTLYDLVSYNHKHNEMNGEDNRDGENNNISWNSGVEGETDHPEIIALRRRRIRSMAVILFLSQGVPMMVAGDEFARSQQGNNNAWCQDSEISWIDWQFLDNHSEQFRFFKKLISLRRNHPVFRRKDFFLTAGGEEPLHLQEISWQALHPGQQDWGHDCHTLAFTLNGSQLPEGEDDDFFVMLNGHGQNSETFTIPSPPTLHTKRCWRKIIDTAARPPADFITKKNAAVVVPADTITVVAMGCVVLQSCAAASATPPLGKREKRN